MAKARILTNLVPQAPTAHNARLIVRERVDEFYSCAKNIDTNKSTLDLHDLRIAAKRVRYTLEVFADFLPTESKTFINELTTLQDELGALHDSEVMLALLRLLLAAHEQRTPSSTRKLLLSKDLISLFHNPSSPPGRRELEGLRVCMYQQEQRREQCYSAFRRHWEQIEEHQLHEKILAMLANPASDFSFTKM